MSHTNKREIARSRGVPLDSKTMSLALAFIPISWYCRRDSLSSTFVIHSLSVRYLPSTMASDSSDGEAIDGLNMPGAENFYGIGWLLLLLAACFTMSLSCCRSYSRSFDSGGYKATLKRITKAATSCEDLQKFFDERFVVLLLFLLFLLLLLLGIGEIHVVALKLWHPILCHTQSWHWESVR